MPRHPRGPGPVPDRFAAVPPARLHVRLMLLVTFATGVVDAVGYLGLDRVFSANMTGNVVILGMALAGADELPILGPVLALLGFLLGAAIGGRVLRSTGTGWTRHHTALFAAVSILTLLLAGVCLAVGNEPSATVGVTVAAVLGAAMGCQAATARHLAVKDVTTVVVTSTLTGLAADSRFGSGVREGSARRAGAVALILAGAGVGAALYQWHLGAGLVLAGLLVVAATVVGELHRRVAARPVVAAVPQPA